MGKTKLFTKGWPMCCQDEAAQVCLDGFAELHIYKKSLQRHLGDPVMVPEETLPCVAIICQTCGTVRLVSAIVGGFLDAPT